MAEPLESWLEDTLGTAPRNPGLFERALTHPSTGQADYQRLEFLGDRVLGLAMASWLYELHPDKAEGTLNRRLAALVSRATCAGIGREIGVAPHVRLGKQARDDGAAQSGNVPGDVVEALIGALYLDAGFAAAEAFVRRAWKAHVESEAGSAQHPKSALQEWAAAHRCEPPDYSIVERTGPDHSPHFVIRAEIPGKASAEAEGSSKQEAETAAAAALLEKLE